jgi:ATP-independent RNA helicase DbpA
MLDMGFREKIEQILRKVPTERQTALFSATFPPTIGALSQKYQKDPEEIIVETPETEMPEIEQVLYRAKDEVKTETLVAFLKSAALESVLVFCNLKVRVDEVVVSLKNADLSADKIHGDLEQCERERVMAKFRNHSIRILVATDVAARGIDIAGLDAVVNYDMPSDPDQYIHRIGRTGRAGKKGLAVSLVTPKEGPKLDRIREFTNSPLPVVDYKKVAASSVVDIPKAEMSTLSISGGRKNKLRPGDILGAITGDAGVSGDHVGKIEILDHVSYVAIARGSAKKAFMHFQQGKIKGRRFLVQWVK